MTAPDTGRTAEENEHFLPLARSIEELKGRLAAAEQEAATARKERDEARTSLEECAALVSEYAAAAVPEGMEILAKDRDKWFDAARAAEAEAAHLRAENANLRDRVREAEKGRDPDGSGSHPTGGTPAGFPSLRDVDPSRMQWWPIESLPHDGDEADREQCGRWWGPVLLYVPDQYGGVQIVAQMDADMWIVGDETRCFADLTLKPTHWMPLPPPPALGIEAAVPPEPKGPAEGKSPARRAMPNPLSPEPQEAGDHEPR